MSTMELVACVDILAGFLVLQRYSNEIRDTRLGTLQFTLKSRPIVHFLYSRGCVWRGVAKKNAQQRREKLARWRPHEWRPARLVTAVCAKE